MLILMTYFPKCIFLYFCSRKVILNWRWETCSPKLSLLTTERKRMEDANGKLTHLLYSMIRILKCSQFFFFMRMYASYTPSKLYTRDGKKIISLFGFLYHFLSQLQIGRKKEVWKNKVSHNLRWKLTRWVETVWMTWSIPDGNELRVPVQTKSTLIWIRGRLKVVIKWILKE